MDITSVTGVLLGLVLVLLSPATEAQNQNTPFSRGCPRSYQTTTDFNARKISEIIGSQGYQTLMFVGTEREVDESCQKLHLFEGSSFKYTYIDGQGKKQQVSGLYEANPTSFRNEGTLELSGLPPGALDANAFGMARLYPLVANDDVTVFISCRASGLFSHNEFVYVFVPNTPSSLRNQESIQETLSLMGVPLSTALQRSDQTCKEVPDEPPASTSDSDSSASSSDSQGSTAASDTSPRDSTAGSTTAESNAAESSPAESTPAEDASASNAVDVETRGGSSDGTEEPTTETSAGEGEQ